MTAASCGNEPPLTVGAAGTAPADWEEFLAANPAADYSHTAHWHDSVCRHRPRSSQLWLTVRRDGRLLAGLAAVLSPAYRRVARVLPLHRLDSSIEGTSGGPLLHPDLSSSERETVFLQLADAFAARRPGGLATVAFALNPTSEAAFGHLMPRRAAWERHESPTSMVSLAGGIDEVASRRLTMTKRNERNRGLRRGAEVFAGTDPDLVAAYYPIYREATRHWGVAPTPLGLLQDLVRDPAGRVFFTCVRLDGQVIGGHLCLHLGERVFAWNGVTDPAFARTHFPATLCFWGDMVEACRRGAAWLDFGASGGVHSLAGFKKYFGAEEMARGFYVSDSPQMHALRRVRGLADRAQAGAARRWHDGATGEPRPGGPA